MSFDDPTLGMHSWTLNEKASQPFFNSRYLFPWRQPSLVGPSDELGSGAEIQLRQNVVDVCVHRPGRDVEPGGDLAVSHSSGDQLGNLRFGQSGSPLQCAFDIRHLGFWAARFRSVTIGEVVGDG
jgi:hypothetical protein